ncbi:unnamed protein product [Gordionus sp. m RMFG-2023]
MRKNCIKKSFVEYLVCNGDTLQGIALKHDIAMDELKRINRIWTNDALYINKALKIPMPTKDVIFNSIEEKSQYLNKSLENHSSNGNPPIFKNHIPNNPIYTNNSIKDDYLTKNSPTPPNPHPLNPNYFTLYETRRNLMGPELNRYCNQTPPCWNQQSVVKYSSAENLNKSSKWNPLSHNAHVIETNDTSASSHGKAKMPPNQDQTSPSIVVRNGKSFGGFKGSSSSLLSNFFHPLAKSGPEKCDDDNLSEMIEL